MAYEGWLGSVRCSSNLSSVWFDARYFELSPLLGSINLEPISSQIERLGIDCHLWRRYQPRRISHHIHPSLPPAPLGFNNGLMGTNGIHWQRDMDTLGSDWLKY